MSETKFTPGPWHKDERSDVYVRDSEGDYIAGTYAPMPKRKRAKGENEANAHLIAAAPDMYEELECARDVFRFYQSHHEFKGGTEKAIWNKEIADRIDRLLAKARGDA
jgi:hypothetical protein